MFEGDRGSDRAWTFAVMAISLVLLSQTAGAETAWGDPPRPNILLLVAEDLSPRIGAFGDEVARTPTLDRLAAEGVRYTNVFTTAGVCAPSRSGLIFGQHAISTGTHHMRVIDGPAGEYLAVPPAHVKAFPELLRGAGYFTYQHGKLDYQVSGPRSGTGPSSIWDAEDNEGEWRDREAGQPFFGMVSYLVTHESGVFEPLGSVWPRNVVHFIMQAMQAYQRWGVADDLVPTDPADVVVPPYYADLPEVRGDLARHYDNIQIMDRQVAAQLARLERDGLVDSTIVIFTTDHGDGLPRAKRDLFDTGTKVPMIIRWPEALRPTGLARGGVDSRLVSFVDLTATILAMAGEVPPDHLHGRDFLDPTVPPREYVFASRDRIDDVYDRHRAVRDDRFKYIRSDYPDLPSGHPLAFRDNQRIARALRREYEAGRLDARQRQWFEAPGAERLFDLEKDPFELNDVAKDPAYAEVLDRMRIALSDFGTRVGDLGEIPEPELRERYWPGGVQPETAPPTFTWTNDRLAITSQTKGASIEYSLDRGPWRLYTEPLSPPKESRVAARAVRYGFAESDVVGWHAPAR